MTSPTECCRRSPSRRPGCRGGSSTCTAERCTCRVADAADNTIGYTILTDVTTRPETQGDLASAYWYSENMKYDYLMFGRSPRFSYAPDAYLTTEGDVLRGLM